MRLYYREEGEGQPLIILHGLWGASDNWLPIMHRLKDRFRVIIPDMRNHGQSPHHPQHNYPALCGDLLELIQKLGLTKPHLIGHSMGGKTAMFFLLQYPEYISKAIIIDIAPIAYMPSLEHLNILTYITSVNPGTFANRNALQADIRKHFGDTATQQILFKNIRKTIKGLKWKINPEALQQNINEVCHWPADITDKIYPGPILFIKGEKSAYIPNEGECLKKQFPAARVETIPQAGHAIHNEQPEILLKTIHAFLA